MRNMHFNILRIVKFELMLLLGYTFIRVHVHAKEFSNTINFLSFLITIRVLSKSFTNIGVTLAYN